VKPLDAASVALRPAIPYAHATALVLEVERDSIRPPSLPAEEEYMALRSHTGADF
jgi:hypothetical protein